MTPLWRDPEFVVPFFIFIACVAIICGIVTHLLTATGPDGCRETYVLVNDVCLKGYRP
jgi:hypothetical protein